MSLQSKTFRVLKGEPLTEFTTFLQSEIGLDAYLIREIRAQRVNDRVTELTLLYQQYPDQIIEAIAPRAGGIYTSDIVGSDFDARLVFNYPLDPGTVQSGTFLVDDIGLDTDKVSFPDGYNNYYVKLDISDFGSEAFHEFRIDASKIRRLDNSLLDYSPVGGYVIHSLSSAHLGEIQPRLSDRIRGTIKADIIRISKGSNPQQVLRENLRTRGVDPKGLLAYASTARSDNNLDLYIVYVDRLEPQILEGFPLNNSLFPDVSAPSDVTLIFSTELDASSIKSESFFALDSGFNSLVDINPADITLLEDNRTVRIDTSGYLTNQKIYSIVVKAGLRTTRGFDKQKPEIWTIHVNAYVGGGTGNITDVIPTGGLQLVGTRLGIIPGFGFTMPTSPGGPININPGSGLTPPGSPGEPIAVKIDNTGLTIVDGSIQLGPSGIQSGNINTGQIPTSINGLVDDITFAGAGNVYLSVNSNTITFSGSGTSGEGGGNPTASYITWEPEAGFTNERIIAGGTAITLDNDGTNLNINVEETFYGGMTGHTGNSSIHFTQAEINITESQISDLQSYASQASLTSLEVIVTGHTGNPDIHFTQGDISITESQISDLGIYTPLVLFTGHTGQTDIHFTQSQISITESQISDFGSYTTTSTYNAHVTDASIHFDQLSELSDVNAETPATDSVLTYNGEEWVASIDKQADVDANISTLSGQVDQIELDLAGTSGNIVTLEDQFTGHTGDTSIHFTQLTELSDVSVASPNNGEVLTYSAGTWVSQAVAGAGGVTNNYYSSLNTPQIFSATSGDEAANSGQYTLSTSNSVGLVTLNGQVLDPNEYSLSGSTVSVAPAVGLLEFDEVLIFQNSFSSSASGRVSNLTQESGNYILTSSDYYVEFIAGDATVNLPAANGLVGQEFVIKNSSTGIITLDPDGSETIDGELTVLLSTQYDALTIVSNGTNWIIV